MKKKPKISFDDATEFHWWRYSLFDCFIKWRQEVFLFFFSRGPVKWSVKQDVAGWKLVAARNLDGCRRRRSRRLSSVGQLGAQCSRADCKLATKLEERRNRRQRSAGNLIWTQDVFLCYICAGRLVSKLLWITEQFKDVAAANGSSFFRQVACLTCSLHTLSWLLSLFKATGGDYKEVSLKAWFPEIGSITNALSYSKYIRYA